MIRVHNSLTGEKEQLQPLVPGQVSMYVCGDTVYDLCHMGHARSKINFDVIRRYLMFSGLRVTFVRNITDIDDKIIKRAQEQNKEIGAFTQYYIEQMHKDYAALGILPPDAEPRATEHIDGMIQMTQQLIAKGHAYVAEDGDVMYSVASFAAYGKLSGKKLSDLRAGARVAVDEAKRDPLDFVLWKRAKAGEPSWPSPWGAGRPGWHIECSVMSERLLGSCFDIHGGGLDLKFPHHENEIAQSCAASDDCFARVWMHNGFLNVGEEKMSKSLGNFFTIRDALQMVRDAEVIRYFVLSSHYRGPISYTLANLELADAALERLYLALREVPLTNKVVAGEATARWRAAMDDDFNTPLALSELQGIAKALNIAKTGQDVGVAQALAAELRELGGVLGILRLDAHEFLRKAAPQRPIAPTTADHAASATSQLSEAQIAQLIEQRAAARKAKNFKESDRIRVQLAAHGIVLDDGPQGTTWRRS